MSTERSGGDRPVVLVVDDERGLADLYAVWLDETCDTRVAYGGQAALDELDDSIDVALLDRRMPTLSGDEVAAEIRATGLDCTIGMVTAVDADFDLLEIGIDDYLEKPVSQVQLRAMVERLFARTRLPERFRPPLAGLSKLVAIEESQPAAVMNGSHEHARLRRRIARQLADLDFDAPGFDRETLAAALREPSDDAALTGTSGRLLDQFDQLEQVNG